MKMLDRLNKVAVDETKKFILARDRVASYLNGFAAHMEDSGYFPARDIGLVPVDAQEFGQVAAELVLQPQGDHKFHFGLCFVFGADRCIQAILHCTANIDPNQVILGFNGSDKEYVTTDKGFINQIDRMIIDRMQHLGVNGFAKRIRFFINGVSQGDQVTTPLGFRID